MGRVRVFYGHEGVVPPTGLRPLSAAAPAAPETEAVELVADVAASVADVEVGEVVSDSLEGEPVELVGVPDASWTKGELIAFAEERGIDMTGATKTKTAALGRVLDSIKEK